MYIVRLFVRYIGVGFFLIRSGESWLVLPLFCVWLYPLGCQSVSGALRCSGQTNKVIPQTCPLIAYRVCHDIYHPMILNVAFLVLNVLLLKLNTAIEDARHIILKCVITLLGELKGQMMLFWETEFLFMVHMQIC